MSEAAHNETRKRVAEDAEQTALLELRAKRARLDAEIAIKERALLEKSRAVRKAQRLAEEIPALRAMTAEDVACEVQRRLLGVHYDEDGEAVDGVKRFVARVLTRQAGVIDDDAWSERDWAEWASEDEEEDEE